MDPFVRRLIERMPQPARPLTRNRHFHTFGTPEGKRALQTSRRLRSLQKDILACREEGQAVRLHRTAEGSEGEVKIELMLERVRGRRVALLREDELELLLGLPGVPEALAR